MYVFHKIVLSIEFQNLKNYEQDQDGVTPVKLTWYNDVKQLTMIL